MGIGNNNKQPRQGNEMGWFSGKDDARHDAQHAAANRAKAAGDDEKEARHRSKADELAKSGDVSTYAKSGLGWDKRGRLN